MTLREVPAPAVAYAQSPDCRAAFLRARFLVFYSDDSDLADAFETPSFGWLAAHALLASSAPAFRRPWQAGLPPLLRYPLQYIAPAPAAYYYWRPRRQLLFWTFQSWLCLGQTTPFGLQLDSEVTLAPLGERV